MNRKRKNEASSCKNDLSIQYRYVKSNDHLCFVTISRTKKYNHPSTDGFVDQNCDAKPIFYLNSTQQLTKSPSQQNKEDQRQQSHGRIVLCIYRGPDVARIGQYRRLQKHSTKVPGSRSNS